MLTIGVRKVDTDFLAIRDQRVTNDLTKVLKRNLITDIEIGKVLLCLEREYAFKTRVEHLTIIITADTSFNRSEARSLGDLKDVGARDRSIEAEKQRGGYPSVLERER